MIYKKNSKRFLTVLVLALIVAGLAFLEGNQNFNFPTRAASFTDDRNQQVLTAMETGGTYSIDPLHTNVGFRVRHMGLAIVLGKFTDYTGTISYDANDITKSSVQFSAKVASLDTGVKHESMEVNDSVAFEPHYGASISDFITRVSIRRTSSSKNNWSNVEVGPAEADGSELQRIISSKNLKASSYLRNCAEVWLIVVADGQRISSSAELNGKERQRRFESEFKKILYYDADSECVTELAT